MQCEKVFTNFFSMLARKTLKMMRRPQLQFNKTGKLNSCRLSQHFEIIISEKSHCCNTLSRLFFIFCNKEDIPLYYCKILFHQSEMNWLQNNADLSVTKVSFVTAIDTFN